MFITMSTIGYGEMNVTATFSRIYLLFISLSGLCVTSLLVVAYSEFFELDKLQGMVMKLFDALELKIRMRQTVSSGLVHWCRMILAAKKEIYTSYKRERN